VHTPNGRYSYSMKDCQKRLADLKSQMASGKTAHFSLNTKTTSGLEITPSSVSASAPLTAEEEPTATVEGGG
jgi:hypothetical protein